MKNTKDYKSLYLNLRKRISGLHRVADALRGPPQLFELGLERNELGSLLKQIAYGQHPWSK